MRQLFAYIGHGAQFNAQIHLLVGQAQLTGFAAGHIDHITDQPAQVLGAGVDAFDILPVIAGQGDLIRPGFTHQDFAQAHDQVERCAQFVADH